MKINLLLVLFSVLLLLCACNSSTQELRLSDSPPEEAASQAPTDDTGPFAVSPTGQLMCMVDTLEEAQKIAELYGITLVEHDYGIAVFYTEENPREVIIRGRENGWPELSLNTASTTF